MHNQFKIYCFVAYTPLNMFRALLCPPTAFAATGYRMIAGLDVRPTRQSYGKQWLQRQLDGAPDDGHNSARNMLSGVYATK
jgi:hypothetical protein